MPVTKSAKGAQRVSARRHEENLTAKTVYKKAVKVAKKAAEQGLEELDDLLSKAQSALDKAAKGKSIHPNKASRLKSRLAKKAATVGEEVKKVVKRAASKKTGKARNTKTVTKKATAKRVSTKKTK